MFNTKTTKKELADYLKGMQPKLIGKKFKNLADRVNYTLKGFAQDAKAVVREDLFELANEVAQAFTPATPAPVENSVKLAPKPKTEAKAEEKAPAPTGKPKLAAKGGDKAPAPAEKAPATNGKAATNGKPAPANKPDPKVETETQVSVKQKILASKFPAEYKSDLGNLKLNTTIKSMEDLYKAVVDEGKDIVFAFYWSPRHLAQFTYDADNIAGKKKFKNFPNDLDLSKAVYVSEEGKVAYAVSLYSEVIYAVQPDDLVIENGLRFCKGCEYNLYEVK
jgi:hypothetical protein